MTLDKAIAAIFLVVALIYGYAAFTYPLLPFERNMSFLPNTFPSALSVLAVILATLVLVSPRVPGKDGALPLGEVSLARLGEYNLAQGAGLILGMIGYALLLRPVGFLAATTLFLVGTGWILGERKLHVMLTIALIAAVSIWLLVQQTLGIYLRPLPGFLS